MQKAVAFCRYDSEAKRKTEQVGQKTLIEKWAKKEDVSVIRYFEAVAPANGIFKTPEWRELETCVIQNALQIDHIVTARMDILLDTDIAACMKKADFFGDFNISLSIASKK